MPIACDHHSNQTPTSSACRVRVRRRLGIVDRVEGAHDMRTRQSISPSPSPLPLFIDPSTMRHHHVAQSVCSRRSRALSSRARYHDSLPICSNAPCTERPPSRRRQNFHGLRNRSSAANETRARSVTLQCIGIARDIHGCRLDEGAPSAPPSRPAPMVLMLRVGPLAVCAKPGPGEDAAADSPDAARDGKEDARRRLDL